MEKTELGVLIALKPKNICLGHKVCWPTLSCVPTGKIPFQLIQTTAGDSRRVGKSLSDNNMVKIERKHQI